MKGTEIAELERRYLLPELPDFRQLGTLLYRAPVGLVLQGFELDRSQSDHGSVTSLLVRSKSRAHLRTIQRPPKRCWPRGALRRLATWVWRSSDLLRFENS